MAASQKPYHVYKGERNVAGEREGYGTVRFANGDVYEGEWKAGEKEGRGTQAGAQYFVWMPRAKPGNQASNADAAAFAARLGG